MKAPVAIILSFLTIFTSWAQKPQIVVPFRSENEWGYSDTLGSIKIMPKYDTVSLFDYDMVYKGGHVFAEVKLNGKPMMINEKGNVVVPPKYDYIKLIDGIEEPTFIISRNNKFGLFAKGKEIFPPISEWMADSYPDFYEVHVNGKSGLINSKGQILIPLIYDQLRRGGFKKPDSVEWECISYEKGLEKRFVKLPKENWLSQRVPDVEVIEGVFQDNVNTTIDSIAKQLRTDSVHVNYNSAILYKGDERGIILPDAAKKVYFFSKPYNIQYIKYFSPNSRNSWNHNSATYIIASINSKYGMINEREEQILPFIYTFIEERDGFFLLKQNGKVGFFIWNTIYPVIQPTYDELIQKYYIAVNNKWRFTLFRIRKNGRTGFVGENGVNYFRD